MGVKKSLAIARLLNDVLPEDSVLPDESTDAIAPTDDDFADTDHVPDEADN